MRVYERILPYTFGPSSRFYLTSLPADLNRDLSFEDELEVHVNGVVVAPTNEDGDRQWAYVRDVNAVDFLPLHVPPEGAAIAITYHPPCSP
ncbi:hypothetical protein [Vulgatibacter sp.]|uniref:hypothetical protein n=1 Tax=Vulgatibacter sp. TaxID=1971226 RepID=UPI003565E7A3